MVGEKTTLLFTLLANENVSFYVSPEMNSNKLCQRNFLVKIPSYKTEDLWYEGQIAVSWFLIIILLIYYVLLGKAGWKVFGNSLLFHQLFCKYKIISK